MEMSLAQSMRPSAVSGASSTFVPISSRYCRGRSTELCSATVETILPPEPTPPSIAMFSASVQFFVNATLSGEGAPKKEAIALRQAYTLSAQASDRL